MNKYAYEILEEITAENESGYTYFLLRITFPELEFLEYAWVISNKTGISLQNQLETYTKEYYEAYSVVVNTQ